MFDWVLIASMDFFNAPKKEDFECSILSLKPISVYISGRVLRVLKTLIR